MRLIVSTFSSRERSVCRLTLAALLSGKDYLMYDKKDLWLLIPLVLFVLSIFALAVTQ